MARLRNGIFLLRHLPTVQVFYQSLIEASNYVQNNLYIDFLLKDCEESRKENISHQAIHQLLCLVYNRPRDVCSSLDIHVLLPPVAPLDVIPRKTRNPLDGCIIGESLLSKQGIDRYIQTQYVFDKFSLESIKDHCGELTCYDETKEYKTYGGAVIGGTFDRIHDGHKLLISTALLMANNKITIGVADGPLLGKKLLKELIEPVEIRIDNVVKMIGEYKPGLKHKVVPLAHTCGPSGTDDDLDVLVVSQETMKSASIVNETRKNNGLKSLDVLCIDTVEESCTVLPKVLNDEKKASSSANRVKQLGILRKEPNLTRERRCYVIGITGGIASGKTSIVKRLEKLGAYVVDCDKLGHLSYLPGRNAYIKIVSHFGKEILNDDDTINRRKLGAIVFSKKEELSVLNDIVWPEIQQMMADILEKVNCEGEYDVVVYEGAIIFESGLDKIADEIWCSVIPIEEAVVRLQERNGLSADEARLRICSQMSNKERVDRSHVIFSTLWEPEFTQSQVEKAWLLLKDRISH